jgi:hypothetical protein
LTGWSIWRLSEVDRPYPDRSAVYHFAGVGMNSTTQLKKRREQRRVRKEDEWNAYKEEWSTIQKKRKIYEIRNNLRQKILR